VPLPFFFLFPLPFFFSCCRFFSLFWSSGSWCFRSPPSVAGHLCVPTAPFSHHHLPQRCFRPNLVRASPIDRLAFYFTVLVLFPVGFFFFVLPVFWFWLFPVLFFLCLFFVCFIFAVLPISSASISLPSTYCRALFHTPRNELQMHLSVVEVCLNVIGFSLFFLFSCICFFPVFLLCFCL
jgi:hypothetical protein